MEMYTDFIGNDQYSASYLPPSNADIIKTSRPGYYEDSLRMSQYGIPGSLNCQNPNPYITDNINESQRHQPIRTNGFDERNQMILSDKQAYDALLFQNYQKYFSEGFEGGAETSSQESNKTKLPETAPTIKIPASMDIDPISWFIIFLFIVLICILAYLANVLRNVSIALREKFKKD